MRNVSDKFVVKIKTHILSTITFLFKKSCRLWDNVGKTLYSWAGCRWQYSACVFHVGYL